MVPPRKRIRLTPVGPASMVNTSAGTKAMNMKTKSRRPRRLRGSLRKRVGRLEKDLLLNVDRKYKLSTSQSTSVVTKTAPHVHFLNNVSQGSAQQNRNGIYVNLGKGHCSMLVRWDHSGQTATAGNHIMRVLVVLQKDTQKTAFTVDDIFRSTSPDVHEFFDFQLKPVFQNHRILYDKVFEAKVPSAAADTTANDVDSGDTRQIINFGWNCNNFRASYPTSGATAADLEYGSVNLVILTSSAAAGRLVVNYDVVQYFTEKKSY